MLGHYKSGSKTPIWDFMDLFANNFGLLYNSVINELLQIWGKPPAVSPNYFMIGYEIGNIFYLVFFKG